VPACVGNKHHIQEIQSEPSKCRMTLVTTQTYETLVLIFSTRMQGHMADTIGQPPDKCEKGEGAEGGRIPVRGQVTATKGPPARHLGGSVLCPYLPLIRPPRISQQSPDFLSDVIYEETT
jgi:hypothetical protein